MSCDHEDHSIMCYGCKRHMKHRVTPEVPLMRRHHPFDFWCIQCSPPSLAIAAAMDVNRIAMGKDSRYTWRIAEKLIEAKRRSNG